MRAENQIAAAVLAGLRSTYPDVFRPRGMRRVPLAADIKRQVRDDGYPAAAYAINLAVKRYMRDPEYLRCLVAGAVKVGLGGIPAGRVTDEEATAAALKLLRILSRRAAA